MIYTEDWIQQWLISHIFQILMKTGKTDYTLGKKFQQIPKDWKCAEIIVDKNRIIYKQIIKGWMNMFTLLKTNALKRFQKREYYQGLKILISIDSILYSISSTAPLIFDQLVLFF